MTINFNQLNRDIWPLYQPPLSGREVRLADYALSGIDLVLTDLERRITVAEHQVALTLDYAINPDDYDIIT